MSGKNEASVLGVTGGAMSIKQKIYEYILKNYLFTDDPSALGENESFLEKGIIDSTGILEVIEFLRVEFGVRVEDDEMIPANLDSVARLAEFTQRKLAAV